MGRFRGIGAPYHWGGARAAMLSALALVLVLAWPGVAVAEVIPPHLAKMAASLYQQSERALGQDEGRDPEHTASRRRALEILQSAGVHRWAVGRATAEGLNAALAERLGVDRATEEGRQAVRSALDAEAGDFSGAAEALAAARGESPNEGELETLASQIAQAVGEAEGGLARAASIVTQGGETVDLKWSPETDRFFVNVADPAAGGDQGEAAFTTLGGRVSNDYPDEGDDVWLDVEADEQPVQVVTPRDIVELRKSILGTWEMADGTIFELAGGGGQAGEVDVPAAFYDEQIAALSQRLEAVKATKIFLWENAETGEVVRQRKFRRLREPFEYLGEGYSDPDAEQKMAELKAEIRNLEAQRGGLDRLPMDQYDPVGFEGSPSGAGGGSITITVHEPDGVTYRYDRAQFDGKRIIAKRTFERAQEINREIPLDVRKQLVASWDPPQWLEIDALLDYESGDLVLIGQRWALHVTYSPPDIGETEHEIHSIHTPFAKPIYVSRSGVRLRVAPGAGRDALP